MYPKFPHEITLTTWNINSVRFRIDLVAKFIKSVRPDILCLQETKCPDDRFPLKRFKRLGYDHVALNGQKGHHGVVVLSRLPFEIDRDPGLLRQERLPAIPSIVLGERAGLKDPITLHNFMSRPAATFPIRRSTRNSPTSLPSLTRCARTKRCGRRRRPAIIVGDLNVAPLEYDVWSHRQLLSWCRTPRSSAKTLGIQKAGGWVDAVRAFVPEPAKLFTWWSYRSPDWTVSDRGRRLDHIWTSGMLADRVSAIAVARDYRSAVRPSDHVPVTATLNL